MAADDLDSYAMVWTPNWSYQSPGDPARCRHSVPDGGRSVTSHQCTRKPVVFHTLKQPAGRFGFCKLHDPVEQRRQRQARESKWKAEWAARDAAEALRNQIIEARAACIDALRQIEAGHNDPRALAREYLQRLDALSPKPGGAEPGNEQE